MNSQSAKDVPIVLGDHPGFTLDDLSVTMLREWAAQVEHQYISNTEMQEKRSIWSMFGHGMLETVQDFLGARDVDPAEIGKLLMCLTSIEKVHMLCHRAQCLNHLLDDQMSDQGWRDATHTR